MTYMNYWQTLKAAILGKSLIDKASSDKTYKNLILDHVQIKRELDWLKNNPEVVVKKDPNGLIKEDLARIKRLMNQKPYKVGDSIELVASKAAELKLYNAIKKHLVAAKITTL